MNVREWVALHNEDALLADGFEDALVGVGMRCGQPTLAVYDVGKCIEILVDRDGMTHDEASEFFEFNVVGAWVGEGTPLFLYRREEDDDEGT